MLRSIIVSAAAAAAIGLSSASPAPADAQLAATGPSHGSYPVPASPASQRNAIEKAKDYLDYSAYSRKGLIEQLVYEGFSVQDATFGVDSLTVDWNEQAAKKAQDYLDYSAYSKQGLMEQLEYEGFTPSQAAYGVSVAYQ